MLRGSQSQAVTVQVTDNDYDPPPISISDARAGEADGSMEFFVTVAPSEREMSVNWNTVTETGVGVATADTDYDRDSGKLTFAVGETAKTITVEVLDDALNETDETFKVVLSGQLNASLGKNSGTGTIEDDDEGTVVTIHPQGPRGGTEEGQPAKFILQRVGGTGAIYVDLEISQEGEFLWSLQPTKISPQIPAGVNELAVEIDNHRRQRGGGQRLGDSHREGHPRLLLARQPGRGHVEHPGQRPHHFHRGCRGR